VVRGDSRAGTALELPPPLLMDSVIFVVVEGRKGRGEKKKGRQARLKRFFFLTVE